MQSDKKRDVHPAAPYFTGVPNPQVNILVLLPDEGLDKIVAAFLAKEGYNVIASPNGDDALKRIERSPLDVLIMQYPVAASGKRKSLRYSEELFEKISQETYLVPMIVLTTEEYSWFLADKIPNVRGLIDIRKFREMPNFGLTGLMEKVNRAVEDPILGIEGSKNSTYDRLGALWEREIKGKDIRLRRTIYLSKQRGNPVDFINGEDFFASDELGEWMKNRLRMKDSDGTVVCIREGSKEGVAVAPIFGPIDPKRLYSNQDIAMIVKPIPSVPHFYFYIRDYLYYGMGTDHFPLVKPVKVFSRNGQTLALFDVRFAPSVAYVCDILDIENEFERKTIDAIVRISYKRAAKWFKETTPETAGVNPASILSDYCHKSLDALLHASEMGAAFTPDELQGFSSYLKEKLKAIRGNKALYGRIFDNSPNNSGLIFNAIIPDKQLVISRVESIIRERYNTEADLQSVSSEIIAEALWDSWVMWDQYIELDKYKNIKGRHAFEDFFAMADSYPAKQRETQKLSEYADYFKALFNEERRNLEATKINDHWDDFILMGFYRNLRKADLFFSVYMKNNDADFQTFRISEATYISNRESYIRQWKHHLLHAEKYAVMEALIEIPKANPQDVITILGRFMTIYIINEKEFNGNCEISRTTAEYLRDMLNCDVGALYSSPLFKAVRKLREGAKNYVSILPD